MPLITQHSDAAVNQEFLAVYDDLRGVSQNLARHIDPPRIASPGVNENLPMPFFVHKINFVKTLDVGANVHHVERWPVAVISGPYRLQAIELVRYRADALSDTHIQDAKFRLKQTASKRQWDTPLFGEDSWDTSERVSAEWSWGVGHSDDPGFVRRAGWDMNMNTPDGDTLFLEFSSRITSSAPAGREWRYSALLSVFYMPVDVLLFESGERI